MNRSPLLLLSLLGALLVNSGCTPADSQTRAGKDLIFVKLAPVTVERTAMPVTASGTLGAKEEIALSFKTGGVVARVFVDAGQTVHAGQQLAALDLGEIEPALTRARTMAEKAARDYQRIERLYADSVVSVSQWEDAKSARDAAQAEYEAAQFNRARAVITAPADGVILRRTAESGEVVSPGTPVLTLGSRAKGQVLRVGLADRDVVRLGLGDPATVRFDALPDRVFEGRVSEIGASADASTGTYGIEIALSAAAPLASGLVGSAEIRPRAQSPVALVPVEALLEANGSDASVFTLSGDGRTAERRLVRIAFLSGERVAIRSGLEGVSTVITEGAARLSAGDRVMVTR
jgi:multidrug efflux system membrane fusion protein